MIKNTYFYVSFKKIVNLNQVKYIKIVIKILGKIQHANLCRLYLASRNYIGTLYLDRKVYLENQTSESIIKESRFILRLCILYR